MAKLLFVGGEISYATARFQKFLSALCCFFIAMQGDFDALCEYVRKLSVDAYIQKRASMEEFEPGLMAEAERYVLAHTLVMQLCHGAKQSSFQEQACRKKGMLALCCFHFIKRAEPLPGCQGSVIIYKKDICAFA